MKITYDKSVDAAYVYLSNNVDAKVAKTYPCDPSEVGGMINLDFDQDGRLIGVEVLDAQSKLAPELLQEASE